jgi:hypothetical protein
MAGLRTYMAENKRWAEQTRAESQKGLTVPRRVEFRITQNHTMERDQRATKKAENT